MSDWFRVGSIYQLSYFIYNLKREVEFRSLAKTPAIRSIRVLHYDDGITCFQIDGTGFSRDMLLSAIVKIYKENEYDLIDLCDTTFNLYCNTEAMLDTFFSLVQFLNQQVEYATIPEELCDELRKIFKFLQNQSAENTDNQQHSISEFKSTPDHLNPTYEYSFDLYDLFQNFRTMYYSTIFKNKCKRLLASGVDPNQRRPGTKGAPLHVAVLEVKELDIIESLLFYGANPFMRMNGSYFTSAIEAALETQKYDKLNVIIAAFSNPEKKFAVKIVASDIQYENNQIVTRFWFSNGNLIETFLKIKKQLSLAEIDWILSHAAQSLYKENDPTKEKLKNEIQQDLEGENKIIEIIRHGDDIIGFNLFEIIINKENTHKMHLHFNLSLLLPAYRGLNIMIPLDFRLAYSLQRLNQDFIIGVFFLSVHINSYRKASLLHAPKYQPEKLDGEIHTLLETIYGKDASGRYVHEDSTCYVNGECMVEGATIATSGQDYKQRFFADSLGVGEGGSTKSRAVPVFFNIGHLEYNEYAEKCKKIGLDLSKHTIRLAYLLLLLLEQLLTAAPRLGFSEPKNRDRFSDSKWLFWQEKQIPKASHVTLRLAAKF